MVSVMLHPLALLPGAGQRRLEPVAQAHDQMCPMREPRMAERAHGEPPTADAHVSARRKGGAEEMAKRAAFGWIAIPGQPFRAMGLRGDGATTR
jgi:hypothetical protein